MTLERRRIIGRCWHLLITTSQLLLPDAADAIIAA
jgi:hypothetical protein